MKFLRKRVYQSRQVVRVNDCGWLYDYVAFSPVGCDRLYAEGGCSPVGCDWLYAEGACSPVGYD